MARLTDYNRGILVRFLVGYQQKGVYKDVVWALQSTDQLNTSGPVSYRGAAFTMLSTLTIISAASAADVRTCFLTWYDSVTPISTMSPIRPWVMSKINHSKSYYFDYKGNKQTNKQTRIEKTNGSYITKEYKSSNAHAAAKKQSFPVGCYLFTERKRKSESNNLHQTNT